MHRQSGILLHISSLPGPFGIGELGPASRLFLRDLASMGQTMWQVLPLGPTGYGDSPYQCLSSFAGNELLISLEDLIQDGLLEEADLADAPPFSTISVDFGAVVTFREKVYRRLYDRFHGSSISAKIREEFRHFCESERIWLDDYALFRALKKKFFGKPWPEWPLDLARRDPASLEAAREELKAEIEHTCLLQFLFERQWSRFREEAKAAGVQLVGDIPIFTAHDSADVWARQELFYLDEQGQPTVVAGVPPDYFSATGQLWGNPLYRWELHAAEGYAWWAQRLRSVLNWVDIVRIDHFRGFEAYWEIPGDAETAIDGRWVKGPGIHFFDGLRSHFDHLPIIAEDLGLITDEVHALREATGFPGMRIAQFSFGDPHPKPSDLPDQYPENCVAYTGTHDNETLRGWLDRKPMDGNTLSQEQIDAERGRVRFLTGHPGEDLYWPLVETLYHGTANSVILPLQDVLELGPETRMNQPGTSQGNWQWRCEELPLPRKVVTKMLDLTEQSRRTLVK